MAPPPSRKIATTVIRPPPSPELISQDCAFPPFPIMPKSRSNTPTSDSDGETLRKPSYPKSNLSSPRGSIHPSNDATSKSRSRRASTASSKTTSTGRSRAKTIDTKQEAAAPPPTGTNMKRRPSLSNLFGMRKTPAEKIPPLPTTVQTIPNSRKGSRDDQEPLQPVQSAPAGPPIVPIISPPAQNVLEQLQSFDFQVSGHTNTISNTEASKQSESAVRSPDRASVASSVYDDDPPHPGVAISPATPINEKVPKIGEGGPHTLSRLDGPGNASTKEPSYKAKRPAPIDSNLKISVSPQSQSQPTFTPPPIRTGTFPPNSIGNLKSPKPVRTPDSVSFATAPVEQPVTATPATNLNRASIDSASSYGSDASLEPSMSSQSSPPRDEVRREMMDTTRDGRAIRPFSSNLPQPVRPRPPRLPTDSPTDPLFQNGLLSSIPPSPSTNADASLGLASNGFDFRQSPSTSTAASPGPVLNGFDFRPRQMSSAGGERPKQFQARHVPQRSQTMGANKGTCRGCDKTIASNQKSVSSADGRLTGKYHKECFVCHSCKSLFPTADFYVLRDHPYCAHHYHELNGTLCVGCGKGIEGQYLEGNTNNASTSKKFHAQCLTCAICRCQLRDDYFEFNGRVYCERDAFRASSPLTSKSQYDTAPSRPSPLSQGMLRADSDAAARRFPERRTTKLMMMGTNGNLNII
jgi:LIM domain